MIGRPYEVLGDAMPSSTLDPTTVAKQKLATIFDIEDKTTRHQALAQAVADGVFRSFHYNDHTREIVVILNNGLELQYRHK